MSTARLIKDDRPDLTVITNDFLHSYRKRLDATDDTIDLYSRLVQAVGTRRHGKGVWERFDDKEKEKKAVEIISTAIDQETVWSWLHMKKHIINKIPKKLKISHAVCDRWTDGLVVVDEPLCAKEAKIWAKSGAFIILDPPYEKIGLAGRKDSCSYHGDHEAARSFCEEIIKTAPAWCLFERKGSALYQIAHEITAWSKIDPVDIYREMYTNAPHHVRDEVMVVHGVPIKNLDNVRMHKH